jgi:hypothetical protein
MSGKNTLPCFACRGHSALLSNIHGPHQSENSLSVFLPPRPPPPPAPPHASHEAPVTAVFKQHQSLIDRLWSLQRHKHYHGFGPSSAQPSSCLCQTCATRLQQHSTPSHCRLARNNWSACSFCLPTRPLTHPNFSCRIGRPLRFFLS